MSLLCAKTNPRHKMLTRITLSINGKETILNPDCLMNWGEVMCTYKRSEFSGVVRSFTSKFEFVNEAYNMLIDEFVRNRFMSDVMVAIYIIDDNWEYHKQFECPLNFSTVQIENGVFSVAAIDNSLAAQIKANKGTKYEFKVGTDIVPDGTFHFDRLPMTENVTYAFTQGESEEETGAIQVSLNRDDGNVIWLGSVGDELSVGGTIFFNEDQENNPNSFLLEAYKQTIVTLQSNIVVDPTTGWGQPLNIMVQQVRDGSVIKSESICSFGQTTIRNLGAFENADALNDAYPEHSGTPTQDEMSWIATINGIVWKFEYIGWKTVWKQTRYRLDEYLQYVGTIAHAQIFEMMPGDKLRAVASWSTTGVGTSTKRIISSNIQFSWKARGEICDILAFKPITILDKILERLCDGGNTYARGYIDMTDSRLAHTVLMAAENIRGISGAKFYSSFNEFCDWMETVFGYTYYIGAAKKSNITQSAIYEANGFIGTPYTSDTVYHGEVKTEWIYYNTALGKFMVSHDGYHYQWDGMVAYNHPGYGGPWTDRLYKIGGKFYYFEFNENGTIDKAPKEYRYSPADATKDFQQVVFVHRSQLFRPDAAVKKIEDATEIKFSVDHSSIYSTVEIGYDKKDYDSINGRDEFNFNNTYSTGCSINEKKLSLISKYRADCYGMEFAAQKRGEDTTDSNSDNDVFFAYCDVNERDFTPNRSVIISGALSDSVFNGQFSPLNCINANAGYIGMQSESLLLTFASSKGNGEISIDGQQMSGNITLNTPLCTPMELEFYTGNIDTPDPNCLYEVVSDGIKYRGYLREAEEHYARESSAKYILIIKSMEL